MELYLVRHGEAKPESADPRRPLTERGRKEVEEVARAAAEREVGISEILHSDKLRAKETAEILARFLSPPRGLRETKGLSPDDDPSIMKAELEAAAESVLVVGHLPHLSRLASLLVAGDAEREVVKFPSAAMICLARGPLRWELKWELVPKTV